jgi:apolipoprotein N-acyltransferase
VRAIENGFTLMRCTSNGVGGVWNSRGTNFARASLLRSGSWTAMLPIERQAFTFYRYWGDVFAYLCGVFTLICIVAVVVPIETYERITEERLAWTGARAWTTTGDDATSAL